MAADFEWRFGDEGRDLPDQKKGRRRPNWRTRLLTVAALLALALVAFFAWWRARQADLAEVEAQVLDVAERELRALAAGDVDLYLGLQDDADPNWYEAQGRRASLRAFLPPPLPSLTATATLTIENARVIRSDLARVEVLREAGLPGGELAPFRATLFYRYTQEGTWLHTRPDPLYAGPTTRYVGSSVELVFHDRDTGRLPDVNARLNALAKRFCELAGCEWRAPLELDFSGSLDTLVEAGDVLPAPYVVGIPDDEAALEVWEDAVYELLLDRLIARQQAALASSGSSTIGTAGTFDEGALFRARLYQWLRVKLGIRPRLTVDLERIGAALDSGEWLPVTYLLSAGPDGLDAEDPLRPLAEAQIDLLLTFIDETYGADVLPSLMFDGQGSGWPLQARVSDALASDAWNLDLRYADYARRRAGRRVQPPGAVLPMDAYDLVVPCQGEIDLWGVRLDGEELAPLASDTGFSALSWSPDGARLLALRRAGAGGGMYVVDARGSGVRPLSAVPTDAVPSPYEAWSPDGRYVAYMAYTEDRMVSGGVVEIDGEIDGAVDGEVDGERSAALGCTNTVWSPDGAHLACTSNTRQGTSIVLAGPDGSDPRPIGDGWHASWSPDGARLALADWDVQVYDVTGDQLTRVLSQTALYELLTGIPQVGAVLTDGLFVEIEPRRDVFSINSLAWSPTGEWIALASNIYVQGGVSRGALVLVRPDGSEPTVALALDAGIWIVGWVPDGRRLLLSTWSTLTGTESTAMMVNLDGGVLFQADDAALALSPDGRYLAVSEPERLRVWRLPGAVGGRQGVWSIFDLPARCGAAVWNPCGPSAGTCGSPP